ncbi:hypothetical protein AV274_0960 [Blastocystis sp. ATCC 50177/Nand II]|uniref:CDAN1-interacting nuclease 1 n=2 Tax=Blastocystis sp. subtype 1 (strain ATCC 50177 / NandII) TaxID=478820 RepID=A0A196SJS4_BLAHN|nr:hypothetical protein AV274_4273 [Blastocystis sp. ATCC 50177/Nand II]OAO17300.1 hypothetical protein AV274_0960 [Blastocystis sp. ATCC 50177/Nand II]
MAVRLSDADYARVRERCVQLIRADKTLGTREAAQFPTIPYNTIQYIYRQCYHQLESEEEARIAQRIAVYNDKYERGVSIQEILREEDLYMPIFLHQLVKFRYKLDDATAKRYLQNPSLLADPTLESIIKSYNWSGVSIISNHDKIRQSSGLEYEYLLKESLRNRGIPFQTEVQLRLDGLPKTPDIVLDCPILIETAKGWKEVNWIESKAIFGDVYWQNQNAQQFFSYLNRLGPGCVIYWFGFIDGYTLDPRITLLSSLPANIHTIDTLVQ